MSDVEELFLEHLECPVCFEFYEEPKVFTNCGHTVCASCIGGILAATPGNKKTISCPQCRVQSAVPAGGLQTNYVVAGIAEKVKLAHARGPCAVCNKRTSEDHFYKCDTCKDRIPNAAASVKITQMCSMCALEHHPGHYVVKSEDTAATAFVQVSSASGIVECVPGSPSLLPSPPISAFRLFKKGIVDRIRKTGMSELEVSTKARDEWNALNAAARAKWEEMARFDRARYERQMHDFRQRAKKRPAEDNNENKDVSPPKAKPAVPVVDL